MPAKMSSPAKAGDPVTPAMPRYTGYARFRQNVAGELTNAISVPFTRTRSFFVVFAGNLPETDNAHIPTSGERHPPRGCGRKSVANYSGRKFVNGFPASPQNPVFMSRFAHLHIMHPEPKHLKNFARNSQWIRGKKVRNSAFFSRFHRPGLERLLACHDA